MSSACDLAISFSSTSTKGRVLRTTLTAVLLLGTSSAFAHTGHAETGSFFGGFAHPWAGLDHVLAMLAVGIWATQIGSRAQWLLPLVFPLLMLGGGAAGMSGLALPGVETGIALSALLLGALMLLVARPKTVTAAALVGVFALFHGHAHGAELPAGNSALLFSAGFVLATLSLHVLGMGLGLLHRWQAGALALRGAGGLIAASGAVLLMQSLV